MNYGREEQHLRDIAEVRSIVLLEYVSKPSLARPGGTILVLQSDHIPFKGVPHVGDVARRETISGVNLQIKQGQVILRQHLMRRVDALSRGNSLRQVLRKTQRRRHLLRPLVGGGDIALPGCEVTGA